MLFRRSTENEWNMSQNLTTASAIIKTMASSLSNTPFSVLLQATQRGRYITFFTLVGDIHVIKLYFMSIGDISHRQANCRIPVKYSFCRYTFSAGTTFSHGINNWANEASPTLWCSIEISRDMYIYYIGA